MSRYLLMSLSTLCPESVYYADKVLAFGRYEDFIRAISLLLVNISGLLYFWLYYRQSKYSRQSAGQFATRPGAHSSHRSYRGTLAELSVRFSLEESLQSYFEYAFSNGESGSDDSARHELGLTATSADIGDLSVRES